MPSKAGAQQALDPTLRELIQPVMLDAVRRDMAIRDAVQAVRPSWANSLALEARGPGQEPLIGVFVRMRSPAALDELRAAGAEIGAVVDDLVSTRIPLSAIETIGASASIERVEAARAMRIENDSSLTAIHVNELRTRNGNVWAGSTGAGVIVGVYDTGIDFRHDDFLDGNGQTRLLGLWDQLTDGVPPQGFTSGNHCSPAALQTAVTSSGASGCQQRDFHGHGSHVAGSAAGDGSSNGGASAWRYAGVAPNADLLVVNGGPGIFFENLIIDGLTWMRQEGLRLGRPMVVNLSLGGQFGAHDGTRLYERFIDALTGPGFIVVISVGNEGVNQNTTPLVGGRLIHARGIPSGTQSTVFEIDIPAYTPNASPCTGNYVNVSFWYESVDQLRIEVERPAGTTAFADRGQVTTGDDANGRIRIDNGSGGVNSENGDIEAAIALSGCGTSGVPQSGRWKIRVTPQQPGSGLPFDMWITGNAGAIPVGATGFDNRFVVGSPGNARRAITVGAFVTRLCWPSIATAGQICYTQREEVGDLARFSGAGPTRDGRLKPEITAPGIGVMSVLSQTSSTSQQRIAPDNLHSVREGTSMAAPHVTGTVALLLEADPGLTPEDVKSALAVSAATDEFTTRTYGVSPGSSAQDWWGWGKLNARDALLSLSDGAPAILAVEASSATTNEPVLAARGTRLPLLRLDLEALGFEPIDVTAIGFDVTGTDPAARLLLVRDANGNGVDPEDAVVGSVVAALNGAKVPILVQPDSLRVFPFVETPVYVAIELSGQAPHGAGFQATLDPATIRTLGVRSGAVDQVDPEIAAVESGTATTTLLDDDALLSFSENPVRDDDVVFNFAEAPTTAAVYTLTGRRVVDLCTRDGIECAGGVENTHVVWDLTNDEGEPVAPGVYLVVFRVSGQTFRERLMVLRPGNVPASLES
ncbi:MAG: S8 family serine peptidase [Longimicrobiales bacterium]